MQNPGRQAGARLDRSLGGASVGASAAVPRARSCRSNSNTVHYEEGVASAESHIADRGHRQTSDAQAASAERAEPAVVGSVEVNNADCKTENRCMNEPVVHTRSKVPPTIKLSTFDGSSPLESHLAKFENSSFYYDWNSKERLCHLKNSLTGPATQVLWQLPDSATEADVIQLLRNRWGNENQAERFRAELASRRRKAGEPIQAVYNDIRRLLALSYPGESGSLLELIGRDSFLTALGDSALRIRVLDQKPATLYEAFLTVCRMEAYGSLTTVDDVSADTGDRRKVRSVRSDDARDKTVNTDMEKRLRQLEQNLESQRREIRQISSEAEHWRQRAVAAEQATAFPVPVHQSLPSGYQWPDVYQQMPSQPSMFQQPPVFQPPSGFQPAPIPETYQTGSAPPSFNAAGRGRRGTGQGRRRADTADRDVCYHCGQSGHWRNLCPSRAAGAPAVAQSNVSGVQDSFSVCSETYISGYLVCGAKKKRDVSFLLDSGCDRNILPKRLLKKAKINVDDEQFVYAANGAKVKVLGSSCLNILIGGQNLCEKFLITENIDEPILGFEFLKKHACVWMFGSGELCINGEFVKLRKRTGNTQIRRVYVREKVCVPADTSVNVPVRMPYTDFYPPSCDWLTEAKALRPGLFLARTILPENDEFAAVCVLNVSGKDQYLRHDLCVGAAAPGVCVSAAQPVDILNKNPVVDNADDDVTERPRVSVRVCKQDEPHDHAHPAADNDVSELTDGESPIGAEHADASGTQAEVIHSHFSELPDADLFSMFDNEFQFLKPTLESLPDDFSVLERRKVAERLLKHHGAFSRSEFDVGKTDLIQQRIDTGNHSPISESLRRHPRVHLDLIDNTVDQLVSAGIVEPATSPWSFNVVLVKKRDSDVPRVTIDFRRLNDVTVKDRFPLPRIKDCLDALSGSVLFTTLDLSMSLYCVPLHPSDRDKASFVTRKGQFRFKRMAMGLCNSPSAFSRLMSLVLRDLTYLICLSFIDDCLVIGRSFDEHLTNVETVLQRFEQANLRLKPKKCKFFQHQVNFLGHVVSQDGVGVDPRKTSVIKQWPFPKSISELRGFLGISGYYRAYIPNYSEVAAPLIEMLRKGVKVEATERRLKAFEALKNFLTNPPLLAMPSDEGEWVVDCDASSKSLGAVCSQFQGGRLRVIEYASRTLSRAEEAYCVTRREILSVVFALKHFRVYLLGRTFRLRTDHKILEFYNKTREPTGQITRYLDFLSDFDFQMEYRPGSKHTSCDSLSRIRPCEVNAGGPCRQCHKRVGLDHVTTVTTRSMGRRNGEEAVESVSSTPEPPGDSGRNDEPTHHHRVSKKKNRHQKNTGLLGKTAPGAVSADCNQWTPELLRKEQEQDSDISEALQWVETNEKPPWKEMRPKSPMLRALWRQFSSLVVRDSVLCRIFHDATGLAMFYQTVLPRSLRRSFLELIHADAAGHLRLAKSMEQAQRRAWWLEWKTDLQIFIENCPKCAAYHRGNTPRQAYLNPMTLGSPAQRWTIDLVGILPMSSNCRFIFTAIDVFTKFAVAVPIRNKDAKTVARVMVEHIFLKWGLCLEVLSDLGKEFENELFQEIFNLLGIRKLRSSSYRPQTSGAIESWHRVLNSLLAKIVSENQKDWSQYVSYVVFCYNASCHSVTKFSPYFLQTGRDPRWTIDLLLDSSKDEDRTVPEYAQEVRDRLTVANNLVRNNLQKAAASAAEWYDRKVHLRTFHPGDKVRLYYPRRYQGRSPKLQSNYLQTGEIVEKLNESTYLVKTSKGQKIFHTDKIRLMDCYVKKPTYLQ